MTPNIKFKILLLEKGIKANDLAKRAGYRPTTLYNFLNGRCRLSPRCAKALADASSGLITTEELLAANPLFTSRELKTPQKKEEETQEKQSTAVPQVAEPPHSA